MGGADSTTIDLRILKDVTLTRKAIAAGWDVPGHIRVALCDQLRELLKSRPTGAALDDRDANHILKLVELAMVMDKRDLLDAGIYQKSEMPEMRYRGPENRRPRSRRITEPKRIATALARKAAREAESQTQTTTT